MKVRVFHFLQKLKSVGREYVIENVRFAQEDPSYEDINEFIDSSLHSKLIDQLQSLNYRGVIRYSGFVEPLLDKNIYNLIKEVSQKYQSAEEK